MVRAYTGYSTPAVATFQRQPIPGREAEMVANNAGGFGFVLDDWERLNRFLVLGSEGGSYYVNEKSLTAENAGCVIRCIKADGIRTVQAAYDVNMQNRAPKTDSQLFVMALALKHGDDKTKNGVKALIQPMLRTGTHFLHFVAMLDSLGGWNRSKRRIIAEWFSLDRPADLAFQVLKYQNRDGFKMRDALRLAHPKAPSPEHAAIYDWVCGRPNEARSEILQVNDRVHAHYAASGVAAVLYGIEQGLPREALPTEALNDPAVWKAMLPKMPLHAVLRNLGNMTANGVLADDACAAIVAAKLTAKETLQKSRVHPFAILLATLVYKTGHGVRGNKTWIPVPAVLSVLEDAYDLAFDYVKPTGKRILIGVDISGSMGAPCVGTPIPASTAATAMAITLARLEPHATVVQFDTAVRAIVPVTRRTGIASIESLSGGGTDLAAPVLWASGHTSTDADMWGWCMPAAVPGNEKEYDAFVVLTDHETWAGAIHASQALVAYRKSVNPHAKLVCCAFSASHANIVDPQDPLSMGCAGLDANIPSLVSDFIAR